MFRRAAFALLLSFAGIAAAQTERDRAQLTAPANPFQRDPYADANGVDSTDHAAASPNDADLGEQEILKRVERYEPFHFSFGLPFYYTSNVALVRRGELSDFVFVPSLSASYVPRITRTFYGELTLADQQFYYNKYGELDFGSFDARAGFVWYLPQAHDLVLRAQYDYNRLTARHSWDNLYSNHSIFVSAELPWRIGRAQQFSLGADANISLAAVPDAPQRSEFDIYAGYNVNISRQFSLDLVGRIFLRDYYNIDRTDVSEVLAFSANYRVTRWFTASFVSTLAWSQSNHEVFSYDVADVGGAITFSFKF